MRCTSCCTGLAIWIGWCRRPSRRCRGDPGAHTCRGRTTRRSMDERVERWRAETPGCTARIHLNNAGAALMPRSVQAAVHDHLTLEGEVGGYEAADARATEVAAAHAAVGALVGAD